MSSLVVITRAILEQMPPIVRFRPDDAQLIMAHQQLLLGLEGKLVVGFYDTLFAHAPTKAIFKDGERPAREQTLRDWWRRTLSGPFDGNYWTWQALVGLIHVKRKVKNPMMIAMWGWLLQTLRQELGGQLPAGTLEPLLDSFTRLAATVQALTAESYLEHYIKALCEATGFEPELLDRLVSNEIDTLLQSTGR